MAQVTLPPGFELVGEPHAAKLPDGFELVPEASRGPSLPTHDTKAGGGELNRIDKQAIGVDHEGLRQDVTDWAVRHFPASIAPNVASLATYFTDVPASIAEMFSDPEALATSIAGRVPVPGRSGPAIPATRAATPVRDAIRSTGAFLEDAPRGGVVGGRASTVARVTGRLMQKVPQPTSFQDLPLYRQMEHLPTDGPIPEMTRTGIPRVAEPPEAPKQVRGRLRKVEAPAAEPATQTPGAAPRGSAKGAADMGLKPKVRALSDGEEQGIRDLDALQEALHGSDTAPLGNGTYHEPMQASHPLDPMRRDIGAQATARQRGMTTQQVRNEATPIAGGRVGESSPIVPEKALQRMIDTMKDLPREGAARADYVAKAPSPKTQWQLENLRRTLEHLGLVVPAVAAAPTLRDVVMDRLRGSRGSGSTD